MPELEKAKLQPVRADAGNTPDGEAFEVQFNPGSLKLKMTNQTEGGRSRARQRRQHTGSSSTVLTLELIFDSADETTGDANNPQPVSVRQKTSRIEQFVLPKEDGSETPPRVKFTWNDLVVVGIVESVDIDFDLFAPTGVPLRAKVGFSIKDQDSKYQFLEAGPGARNNDHTQSPGPRNSAQPGAGTNDAAPSDAGSNRSASALEGETAPEFAARQGLDPAAWRGLDVDLSAGLTLEVGLEVGFSAGLSVSAEIGFSAGFNAGADLSLKAALGLEAGAGAKGAASADTAAGFALSSAGGVAAAISSVKKIESESAANTSVRAFSAPQTGGDTAASGDRSVIAPRSGPLISGASFKPVQSHAPLAQTGARSHSAQEAAAPVLPAHAVDARAASFGFGVPLRPALKTASERAQRRVCASEQGTAKGPGNGPLFRRDPTVSPWVRLPPGDRGRKRADAAQAQRRTNPCEVLYAGRRRGKRP